MHIYPSKMKWTLLFSIATKSQRAALQFPANVTAKSFVSWLVFKRFILGRIKSSRKEAVLKFMKFICP